MKIRKGYVSNSSSSSFIVGEDLSDKGVACLELSKEVKERLNNHSWGFEEFDKNKILLDLDRKYFLTELVSDSEDQKYDAIKSVENYYYEEGDLGKSPRCYELFNEYKVDCDRSVWLLKQHDVAKSYNKKQFLKFLRETYPYHRFIVSMNEDGFEVKVVEDNE